MIWIEKLKIIVGWTKIDKAKVNRWIRERNIDLLKFTLRRGHYSQRLQAIKGLNSLRERSVIPILLEVARTDFEVVAKEAIKALTNLDVEAKYRDKIEGLEKYWRLKSQPIAPGRYKATKTIKWLNKKGQMKTLERVRQQLKKSMR